MAYPMSSTFIIKYGKLQQWDHFEKSAQWGRFFSQIPKWFSSFLKWFSKTNPEQAPKWFKTLNSTISGAKTLGIWTGLPLTFWNAFNSTALPGVHVVGPEGPVRVNSIFDALS